MPDPPTSLPLPPPGPPPNRQPGLTDEQRMLVDLRDVLYEGSWEDFRMDLRARAQDQPHVFDVVPSSSRTQRIIDRHLRVIDGLDRWEQHYQIILRGRV
ncbi:MAG: hypothetical protein ACE5GE_07840 [Phycisphaerae bacterium]